ncbi:MAG: GMC family oxidoreductase, partial [Acidobacteriota bacterium]
MAAIHVPNEPWDAVIVGSGATGGWAAKVLAERGARVLVLEAGPQVRSDACAPRPWRHRLMRTVQNLRGRQSVQQRYIGYRAHPPELFIDDRDFPYSTPDERPFWWIRGRQVGGRSLTWGGLSLRFSDYEFGAASRDGVGIDWPFRHADLAPAYAIVERAYSVRGSSEGLPQLPDGDFQPAADQSPAELAFKNAIEARWPERRVIPTRSIEVRATNPSDWPPMSSQAVTMRDALATGRVTLRSDVVVNQIDVSEDGSRATGVTFLDTSTGSFDQAHGRAVLLCASTLESTRILLNSRSPRHPDGLGANSGHLGRYLMDHHTVRAAARFPYPGREPAEYRWGGPNASLIPRFQNLEESSGDFLRGYGMNLRIQRRKMPVRDGYLLGSLLAQGEMLPRAENHVTLDPDKTDRWGLPGLRIDCAWSDNETNMVTHMANSVREMVAEAGGELFGDVHLNQPPGSYVHEVGTARMGADAETSVVDPDNRIWETPNVLVTDGACWPSCGWQNPTLTMMAVTVRACQK